MSPIQDLVRLAVPIALTQLLLLNITAGGAYAVQLTLTRRRRRGAGISVPRPPSAVSSHSSHLPYSVYMEERPRLR